MTTGPLELVRRHARAPDLACCRTFQEAGGPLAAAATPANPA